MIALQSPLLAVLVCCSICICGAGLVSRTDCLSGLTPTILPSLSLSQRFWAADISQSPKTDQGDDGCNGSRYQIIHDNETEITQHRR